MSQDENDDDDGGRSVDVPELTILPYGWVKPSPEYFLAIARAQETVPAIVRNTKGPRGKMYSKTEDWIKQLKGHLRTQGLLVRQVGGVSLNRNTGPVMRIQFVVSLLSDSTGEVYTLDWAWANPGQTPGDASATAYTRPWKSFLRGLLMIDQVDEDEDLEPGAYERGGEGAERAPRSGPPQFPDTYNRLKKEGAAEERATKVAAAVGLKPGDAHDLAPPALGDPTREELVALGWWDNFLEAVMKVGADTAITTDVRDGIFAAAEDFFQHEPDPKARRELFRSVWTGTGYTPQGPTGPLPTGAQLRRAMAKLNWK